MPGKHSALEKRQAKHIISSYKKRGTSTDTAKHIAWATVNKEKHETNESWQFNGAGQPVFVGKEQVSQFDPSGTVSPGQPYIPDEVAKMLVKESGLRKADCVPKKVIIRYLESMGLSAGLATEVAQVLRDVYGITPTFDEQTLFARSGSLIEELTQTISESYPMPFIDDSEPKLLNEVDAIGSFLQQEFMESADENYDVVLGRMAMMPPSQFAEVVDFHRWVGPDLFDYFEGLVVSGPDGFAEQVLNGLCWPGQIKFMSEDVQAIFDEDSADDVIKSFKAKRAQQHMPKIPGLPTKGAVKPAAVAKPTTKPAPPAVKIPSFKKPVAVPSMKKQMAAHGKDLPSDPLAAKKPGAALAAHREKQDKDWDAAHAAAKARHADEPTKAIAKAGGSKMKRAGSAAIGLIKKVHSAATTPSKANPDVGPALKKIGKGAFHVAKAAVKTAGKVVAGAAGVGGHLVGAAARGATHGFGSSAPAPSGKKGKAAAAPEGRGILGHIGHAIGKFAHHVKQGFKNATPGIQSQIDKDSEGEASTPEPRKAKARRAKSAVGESTARSGDLLGEMNALFESEYPDLGKTPYGPAGDPKKGPELAKAWMTPQPAGTMEPGKSDMTTRMFSDPDKRDKARKAKLADVMSVIDNMRKQAADAGVPPEGMFLNLYRDMHREKVRYS